MKYEKFEEWMLGKKVTHVGSESSGVIVKRPDEDDPYITVRVKFYEGGLTGETLGAFLRNLAFLEEKPSDEVNTPEGSQINWEVGQEVFCLLRGKGFVVRVGDEEEGSPYTVGVDFGYTFDNYTVDGKMFDDHKGRVLFFSEPVITAELYPPKKPFVPTLKDGESVLLWLSKECAPVFVTIIEEKEDKLFYMHTNGQKDYTSKDGIKIGRLGEEIKWEN